MKNKVLSVILIIIVTIFAMSTAVNALSFTATMSTESNTVPESTEFTVKIKVSNLDVGTNGINSLNGYLTYDTTVFETLSESSIEGLNSWNATFESETGKIGLTKSMFVTSTQEVLLITFKTKSDVTGKKGTISFGNIVASNSETDISATDISTTITVGTASDAPTNTTNTISTNSITSNTIVGNTATNNTTNNTMNNTSISSYVNTTSNTSSKSDMPQTGVSDTLVYLIILAIVVALVFYVKIEKLNKDIK